MADLEIQKGVSGVHVVYGQQNNNMSTHIIFSTRAKTESLLMLNVIRPSFPLS